MVGKVFNEFLGHHTAEEAASHLRKSCKDRYVCVFVIIKKLTVLNYKLSHLLKSIHRNNYNTS